MTLVASGVTIRPVEKHPALLGGRRSSWTPRWLQRQREAEDLARWASDVVWQWSDTMDGVDLAQHTSSAAKIPLMLAPEVQSVVPGPPVTLLVRMLRGQVVDDFQAQANRIAAGMDAPMVRITPYGHDLIKVVLLD
jgi:hypothetical protein